MGSQVCRDTLQIADDHAGVVITLGCSILGDVHLVGPLHDLVRHINEGDDGRSQADGFHRVDRKGSVAQSVLASDGSGSSLSLGERQQSPVGVGLSVKDGGGVAQSRPPFTPGGRQQFCSQ